MVFRPTSDTFGQGSGEEHITLIFNKYSQGHYSYISMQVLYYDVPYYIKQI